MADLSDRPRATSPCTLRVRSPVPGVPRFRTCANAPFDEMRRAVSTLVRCVLRYQPNAQQDKTGTPAAAAIASAFASLSHKPSRFLRALGGLPRLAAPPSPAAGSIERIS